MTIIYLELELLNDNLYVSYTYRIHINKYVYSYNFLHIYYCSIETY